MASETLAYVKAVGDALKIDGDGAALATHIHPFAKEVDSLASKAADIGQDKLAADVAQLDACLEQIKEAFNAKMASVSKAKLAPVHLKVCAAQAEASKLGALYFMLAQQKLRLSEHVVPIHDAWQANHEMCANIAAEVNTSDDAAFTNSIFQICQDHEGDAQRLSTILEMVIAGEQTAPLITKLFGADQTPETIMATMHAAQQHVATPVQLS